ncbi:MAG TPA: DUF3105 domain-containing protein [Gaiellales bacterium]|nr:DUF3105 domain-containing protein [Gaiellales bacterium]
MARQQTKSTSAAKPGRRAPRGLAAGVAIVVVVAAVVGWFAYQASADKPGERLEDLGNVHIQTASDPHAPYNSDPPTSGPHLPYIAPWGIHTRPIPPELQVHNLEDGGVLVQYNCECADLVEKLRAIVRNYDKQVILAPYPSMKSRIALTAWTRLDRFDAYDAKRIVRFIEAYRGIDHHKG